MSLSRVQIDDVVNTNGSPSCWRRLAFAGLEIASFAIPDFVASPRHQRTLRWAVRAGAALFAVASIRRAWPTLRANWHGIGAQFGDAPRQARRIGAAIGGGFLVLAGGMAWAWYRLLERCARALANRGVRYPHLTVGAVSEIVLALLTRRRRRRIAPLHQSPAAHQPGRGRAGI